MPVTFNNVTINRVGLHGGRDKLLDKFPGAAAAYSLRSLNSFYRGPVVQVRESAGNAEADFTAIEVANGTLAAWVGAGNDGFVKTWYDQSGNGNDASQATFANQPQIVASGAVVLENGEPAISSPSGYRRLVRAWGIALSDPQLFYVGKITTVYGGGYSGHWIDLGNQNSTSNTFINPGGASGSLQDIFNSARPIYSVFNATLGQTYLECYENVSTTTTRYLNGVDRGSNSFSVVTPTNLVIGGSNAAYPATGTVQEVVIYATGNASNRTGIESNIASHYGITLS
jgi:hypothetical protein